MSIFTYTSSGGFVSSSNATSSYVSEIDGLYFSKRYFPREYFANRYWNEVTRVYPPTSGGLSFSGSATTSKDRVFTYPTTEGGLDTSGSATKSKTKTYPLTLGGLNSSGSSGKSKTKSYHPSANGLVSSSGAATSYSSIAHGLYFSKRYFPREYFANRYWNGVSRVRVYSSSGGGLVTSSSATTEFSPGPPPKGLGGGIIAKSVLFHDFPYPWIRDLAEQEGFVRTYVYDSSRRPISGKLLKSRSSTSLIKSYSVAAVAGGSSSKLRFSGIGQSSFVSAPLSLFSYDSQIRIKSLVSSHSVSRLFSSSRRHVYDYTTSPDLRGRRQKSRESTSVSLTHSYSYFGLGSFPTLVKGYGARNQCIINVAARIRREDEELLLLGIL